MNHTEVYQLVNDARDALGWQRLKGLPKGEPDMAKTCVLACAFDADLLTGHEPGYATIRFNTTHQRDTVLTCWRERGVPVKQGQTDDEMLFGGELYLWMRHYDVGRWEELILDPSHDERPYEALVMVEAGALAECDDEVARVIAEETPRNASSEELDAVDAAGDEC